MIENRAICTIIAKNYIASARVLAKSFRQLHPDHKCYVLIVDEFKGFINPADECFEIIPLKDIQIPDLESFSFKYNIVELCTAAKALFLDYLIREKAVERLLYLDPDILITSVLDGLFEALGQYDIVLTPHLDSDYPDDGLLPNDGYILRAGIFNLGFIGINSSKNARSFLAWWKPKLYEHCVVDLANGYFVDQKFIDLVPLFFENVLIEKDTGYNVAYWNLHSRRVGQDAGGWTCNAGPLYFFHFSGYSPDGNRISSYLPDHMARLRLSDQPNVRRLFSEYKDLLLKNGYEQARRWPYTFGYFDAYEPISASVRLHYRTCANPRKYGNPFTSKALKRMSHIRFRNEFPRDGSGAMFQPPAPSKVFTPEEQLEAIFNSRAWRWVSRYGRIKERYFSSIVSRFFGFFKTKSDSTKMRPGPSKSETVEIVNYSDSS